MAFDASGSLLIADSGNYRVRKVLPGGIIVTVAGTGSVGYFGDGGPATNAQFGTSGIAVIGQGIGGAAVDGSGNLFIVDALNHRIRKVSTSGIITTYAGNGGQGFSGDGGPAVSAQLLLAGCCATGLAVDHAGNLFFADGGNNRVRKVSTDGIITTVAGNGGFGFSGDNGPAASASLSFPVDVAIDNAENLFIVQYGAVRKVSRSGIITTVAGNGVCCGSSGDGGRATNVQVNATSVAADNFGNLFVAEGFGGRIRKVSADGVISTVAGRGLDDFSSGDGGPARSARFATPGAVTTDGSGNVYVVEGSRIRKISPAGIVTTVAGGGTADLGDGGPATSANLRLLSCNSLCSGLAVDRAGNLFLADIGNARIRKVSTAGIITTVAGGGTDSTGRDGPASSAALAEPNSLAVDANGNLYISEIFNEDLSLSRVRKVSSDGIITTVAGGGSSISSDNGPATNALLRGSAIAVDGAGNLFIVEYGAVRKVSLNGIITTVAGGGSNGDGAPAATAQLSGNSRSIAVDASGTLYIGDYNRIRTISPDGIIHTIAGSGAYGYYSDDGGPAAGAALGYISSIVVDGSGNVYASDWFNSVVHILRPSQQSLLIGSVVDAASQRAGPVSPGKIVVVYGSGLGPSQLALNQPNDRRIGTEAGGTTVSIGGLDAPVLYASATQVAAIVPYGVTGHTSQVAVKYQGRVSNTVVVALAASAPSLFTVNQSGTGPAAALNVPNTFNTAVDPVRVGDFISLYATGEGQTVPAGVDGQLGGSAAAHPLLPVSVSVDGIPAVVQYSGGIQDQVAGLMQVNVQIPSGVKPGGYVPMTLSVGDVESSPAVWIAVAGN